MNEYEEFEATVDPHRAEEQRAAAAEVRDRLRARGILVGPSDRDEDALRLLEVVEAFEAGVEAHGGDLMMDDLNSVQPDDRHFVIPRRQAAESLGHYIDRIQEARARLRHHPRHSD